MIITVNEKGQVTNIENNVLVANSTFGDAIITVVLDGVAQSVINSITRASLSVIRADGLAVDNIYMSVKNGTYTVELTPELGVLDIPGTIQISVQFTLNDDSVFPTITVAGYVHNNIGNLSETEINEIKAWVNKTLNAMQNDIGDKVDKVDSNADYDLLYAMPKGTGATDKNLYRKVLKNGETKANGILGSDEDGAYHIPRGSADDSPATVAQLSELASQKIDKTDLGEANGVAGLNESGFVPLSQLPPLFSDIDAALDKKVDKDSIGQPNGVAGLDEDGNIPVDQLPPTVAEIPNKVDKTQIGQPNGVAGLDETGKVPAANLPSYVDDVINAYVVDGAELYSAGWLSLTEGGSPLTPESGKVYIVVKGEYVNREYRWSGELYAQIKGDIVIGEVTGTAYDGGKGKKTTDDLAALTEDFLLYKETPITESQLDSGLKTKVNNNAKTNSQNYFSKTNYFRYGAQFDNYYTQFNNSTFFAGLVRFDGSVSGFTEIEETTVEPTGENIRIWIDTDDDILITTLEKTNELGDSTEKVITQKGVTEALSAVSEAASNEAQAALSAAQAAQAAADAANAKKLYLHSIWITDSDDNSKSAVLFNCLSKIADKLPSVSYGSKLLALLKNGYYPASGQITITSTTTSRIESVIGINKQDSGIDLITIYNDKVNYEGYTIVAPLMYWGKLTDTVTEIQGV